VVHPTHSDPVLGHHGDFKALRDAVARLSAGRGGVIWVEGEPGIGKSTLVEAALSEASKLNCQGYRALGDELGWHMPLRALIDALGAAAGAEVMEAMRQGPANVLVESLPAVAGAIEQMLMTIDRLCANSPVLLAFDDLQWADDASLLVWQRLGAAVDQIPLLLVSACRPVPVRPTVARVRRNLVQRGAAIVTLGPLRGDDIVEMVGWLAGAAPGPRLRKKVSDAAGNPLYIRELVDALKRESRILIQGRVAELVDAEERPTPELAGAIRDRLDFLSAGTASTLRMAAFLGQSFSVFDLATVTGQQTAELLPALDEAIVAGVVAEAQGRLGFRHELIRQAIYEATPISARSAIHRQAAHALAGAGLPIDRVAVHLASAPDALDGWAVDWLAEHSLELAYRAPELAADLLSKVARQGEAGGPRYESLLRGQARALQILARLDEAEAVARHALAAATDPARAAEATLILAAIMINDGRIADALPVLDETLAHPGIPPLWEARLHAWRAKTLPYAGRRAEGEAEARAALIEGERLGDRLTVGHASQMLYILSDYRTGLRHIDRGLEAIGDHPETSALRITMLSNRAENLEALGEPALAEASLREALVLADRAGTPWLPAVHVEMGRFSILAGKWDEAWAELEPLTGNLAYAYQLIRLGGLAFIAAHRDERATSHRYLSSAASLPEPAPGIQGNAALLWMARAVDAEQRGGQILAAAELSQSVSAENRHELYDRCLWLPDLVRLALAAGDTELAAAAVTAAETDAADEALPRRVAAARRARALLEGDAATLLAVAEDYRAGGLTLGLGQSAEEAAVLLAQAGDAAGARAALTEAARAYLDLGAGWDVRRADARLREYGVRRGPRTVRRRPTSGWDALTPTEQRVAAMVARGRSNPDIAAELLLSRRTVQTHVSNILTKLGFESRIEIARAMARTEWDAG
jgi:DNA-binding CsgD family transcriptional regulator